MICIDDSPAFLLALRATLEAADIEVLAAETHCPTGVKLVEELRPDLVTLDLEMPAMDGAAATRAIAALPDPPVVVIVTGSDSAEMTREAIDAGAAAFVSKREIATTLPIVVYALAGARGSAPFRP